MFKNIDLENFWKKQTIWLSYTTFLESVVIDINDALEIDNVFNKIKIKNV